VISVVFLYDIFSSPFIALRDVKKSEELLYFSNFIKDHEKVASLVLCSFDDEWVVAELVFTAENGKLAIHYGENKYDDIEHAERQERVREFDDVPLQELI
jgi:hypothetical protein